MGEDPEVTAGELAVDLHPERLEAKARQVVLGRKALPG
jgi:hypothetical protein